MDKDTFHNENTGPDAGAQPPAQPEANEQVAGSDAAPAEQTQPNQNTENTEAAAPAGGPEQPAEQPAEEPVEEPVEETPAEEAAEEAPAEQPAEAPVEEPVEETPAEEPAEEAPMDEPAEAPVEEPVEEAPMDEPAGEIPADEIPADEIPTDEAPANEIPAAGAPDFGFAPPPLAPPVAGARLPRRATVVSETGEKIGRVRKGVWYDEQKYEQGSFVKGDDNCVYVYAGENCSGFVDGNDNIRTPFGGYVATLRYFNWGILWLLILALLLAAALLGVGIGLSRPAERAPIFFIVEDTDERADWSEMEDIPLFYGDGSYDEIVPGMSGSYRFLLVNENEHALRFGFEFDEENEYGIDLCFRLKRDGAYVRGEEDYISPAELGFENFTIEGQSESLFEVEWYWRDNDPVDTFAGENEAIYRLLIEFRAEVEDEE